MELLGPRDLGITGEAVLNHAPPNLAGHTTDLRSDDNQQNFEPPRSTDTAPL